MPITLFWFRRDLRLEDNAGFSAALQSGHPVLPLFIYDSDILDILEDRADARVTFIHQTILAMRGKLEAAGGTLLARYGKPLDIWKRLLTEYEIAEVLTNHDYESYAINRDESVRQLLEKQGVVFRAFKDQVIFEKKEVLSGGGTPYTVFTPYSKKWKSQLTDADLQPRECAKHFGNLYRTQAEPVPTLAQMNFTPSQIPLPSSEVSEKTLENYAQQRDYPSVQGTTRLGLHLRFGTVSVRQLVAKARQLSETWLNELVWREFYMMILANFPHVEKHAFRGAYDRIEWRNNPDEFRRWCEGRTGYPIVDAGMRQLNATGFMHNRVRMIAASFLIKHLLIDWRWGDAYFAGKLLDYELASNNGGWQWAAGSGTDAAPYFRVFNPTLQTEKFDKAREYIKSWVPDFGTSAYPAPMVNHEFARERVLKTYREALAKAEV